MSRSSGRLLVFVCLLLLIAQCCAQSSPSSASTSASRSLSSSSAAAVPSARPVLSVATRVSLSENSTYTFVLNTTHPAVIATLPTVTGAIEVLLNIENLGPQDELPRALASTNPDTLSFGGRYSYDRSSGGTTLGGWNRYYAPSTWEVTWDRGFGNWTNGANRNGEVQEHDPVVPHLLIGRGVNDAGVVQGVKGGNVTVRVSFVMFNATAGTKLGLGGLIRSPPLLGDTTASEALIFSPLRVSSPIPQPTYPNYTLPDPAMPFPTLESIPNNQSLSFAGHNLTDLVFVVMPTSAIPPSIAGLLGRSASAILKAWSLYRTTTVNPPSTARSALQWTTIGNRQGFRNYQLIGNLLPNTNYTVWAVSEDLTFLTRPAFFATKDDAFACPLLLPTDLCPGIGYAVPIAERLSDGSPLDTIPDEYASLITTNLQGFSASLLSTACGRDHYSYVSSCLDCYNAYRDWICRIVIPQCAATTPQPFIGAETGPLAPFTVPRNADSQRITNLSYPLEFNELQPCLSTCSQVDRVCPVSLGFICPHRNFNANESYAYIGRENSRDDGSPDTGWPALDVWGNRWCNN